MRVLFGLCKEINRVSGHTLERCLRMYQVLLSVLTLMVACLQVCGTGISWIGVEKADFCLR